MSRLPIAAPAARPGRGRRTRGPAPLATMPSTAARLAWLLILLLTATSGPAAALASQPQPPRAAPAGPAPRPPALDTGATPTIGPWPAPGGAPAAVLLGGDTVLFITTRLGSFTPAERAAAISRRLQALASDPYLRLDTVRIVPHEGGTDVLIDGTLVMTVTDIDAVAVGMPRDSLAARHARAIAESLRAQGFVSSMRIILLGVAFALLTTLATFLIFRFVQRVFPRLFDAIERGRGTSIPGLRIQRLELISADNVADALHWIAKVVRFLTLALLLYVSVPIILSFFPWTRRYADQLFGYIVTPFAVVWHAFLRFLPDFFTIGAIVVVAWYLLKLIRLFFVGIARGTITFSGFYPDWAIPTYQIVRVLVLLFALIAIWPYIPGSDTEAFQGIGVIFGLLISFGSASAIANAVGGIVLTYMRPFRVGDRVKIADTSGDVVEKNLLVTRIRTPKNVDITVPNAMVLGSHIINYSSSAKAHGLILHTSVTIGYDVPWRQVHELLLQAAARTEQVVAEPRPFVLQTALDDFYVAYELNAYTREPNRMARIYSELHAHIQDVFAGANVEIMSPHYRAVRDGPGTVPPRDGDHG